MLTDDDLATIAMNAGEGSGYLSLAGIPPRVIHKYLRIVRAIRTALCPPVDPMPLDGPDAGAVIFNAVNDEPLFFERAADGRHALVGTSGMRLPYDAAGVRALRTACQRFLAAQEGNDGGE